MVGVGTEGVSCAARRHWYGVLPVSRNQPKQYTIYIERDDQLGRPTLFHDTILASNLHHQPLDVSPVNMRVLLYPFRDFLQLWPYQHHIVGFNIGSPVVLFHFDRQELSQNIISDSV